MSSATGLDCIIPFKEGVRALGIALKILLLKLKLLMDACMGVIHARVEERMRECI
jgi:hypothetical protein